MRTRVLRAGSGPDLVLLHGTGGHLEAYARDIAGLAADFRVTAYDMVGHGWSDLPDRPYTIDVLCDHLIGLMDALDIGTAHLSGESLGGWVAAWTAAHHPGPGRPAGAQHPRQHRQQARGDGPAAGEHAGRGPRPERRDRAPPGRVPVPPHGDGHRRAGQPAPRRLQPARASCARSPTRSSCRTPRSARTSRGIRRWVGKITAPTLLLWTDHDPTGGLDEAAMLLDWLPDARLHVIADAGHWPQWEKREEYLRVHHDFLLLGTGRGGVSEIIGMVGMSHSPFATMLPPPDAAAPGGRFLADAARVAAAVAALAPDALVVIGPDHFHANFYDAMPPFVLGVEEAEAFGDFGSRPGPLPVASALAWSIRDGLAARRVRHRAVLRADRRPRHRAELRHGRAARPISRWSRWSSTPPRRRCRRMPRCVALGRSLGAAIRAADAGRVLVIASGGLSHWLPSNDPRDASVPAERRAAMIHGRRDVRAFAAAREPGVRALAGNPDAPVNAAWDTWFLKQLVTADLDPVTDLGDEGLEERAGSGGHEIRTWLIGFAAAGRAAGLDELRAGTGMDHRHGYRHNVRGGLMSLAFPPRPSRRSRPTRTSLRTWTSG